MKLPLAPRPHHDELLSSWLARVAARYDMNASELRTAITDSLSKGRQYPRVQVRRGIDFELPEIELEILAQAVRVNPKTLLDLDIATSFPSIPDKWVSQTGAEDIINRTFIRTGEISWSYCAHCLNEDRSLGRDAYIRQSWCLGCYGYCHRHRTPLAQRCHSCGATGSINYSMGKTTWILTCSECNSPQNKMTRSASNMSWEKPGFRAGDKYIKRAHAIVIKFEKDLFRALTGFKPSPQWMGTTKPKEFLQAVEDHITLLTTNYSAFYPRDRLINQVEYHAFKCPRKLDTYIDIPDCAAIVPPENRRLIFATLAASFGPSKDKIYFNHSTHNPFSTRLDALEYIWKHFIENESMRLRERSQRWPRKLKNRFNGFSSHYP
jgi:hypothetical protein